MKKLLFILVLLAAIAGAPATGIIHIRWNHPPYPFPAPETATEQYGTGTNTAGDTTLRWRVFRHADVPRPWGLVIHGGEFKYGDPGPMAVCRDLYMAGWNCAAIEYRLAEPGHNTHPPSGSQPVGDHGLFPEVVDDVSQAIIAARTGSTPATTGYTTGVVFAVGGSAGGMIVSWFVSAPYKGGDQLDCAVGLSGLYDFHDPTSMTVVCGTDFSGDVHNLFGCVAGDAACDDDGGILDLNSSYRRFGPASNPFRFYSSNHDSMPVNQYSIMLSTAISSGAPYESRMITEPDIPGKSCTRHSFHYWIPNPPDQPDSVSAESISFITTYCPPP